MAVPRHRTSNARKNARRSHHAKSPKHCSPCSNCGSMRISHRICPSCGHYNNRAILKEKE